MRPPAENLFCSQCGVQITPVNANYCWSCGKALAAGAQPLVSWETCQIVRTYTPDRIVPNIKAAVIFEARASAPTGGYVAAKSREFSINPAFSDPDFTPKRDDSAAQAALNELVARLEQDGWHAIGDGAIWFNRQFRRQFA